MTTRTPNCECHVATRTNSNISSVVHACAIQATTVVWSNDGSVSNETVNQTVSGTSAIEVKRCDHQWCTPSFAEPRPSTWPKGLLKLTAHDLRRRRPHKAERASAA